MVSVSGWSEDTRLELKEFISGYRAEGVEKAICTDIERDGMLEGPALGTYKEVKAENRELYLVASGGISGMKDIALLDEAGIDGVIVGKAIYEGKITLKTLESYIFKNS